MAASIAAGCGSSHDPVTNTELTGSARFAIEQAPPDALCLQVTVTGSRSVQRSVDIVPGGSTSFTLSGLPIGSDVFVEQAFAVACGAVDSSSVPTWVSDPVTATLTAGVVADITIVLHHNGQASVTSTFEGDPDGGADAAAGDGGGSSTGRGGSITSVATLVGRSAHGGTTVTLVGPGNTTTTADDGSYSIPNITTTGTFPLSFKNGPYEDTIPSVLVLPGSNAFIVDGAVYQIVPIELPRASRVKTGLGAFFETTPDGATVIAIAGTTSLDSVDVASAQVTTLDSGGTGYFNVLLTPDGNNVVFQPTPAPGNPGEIRVVPARGGASRLLATAPAGTSVAMTSDSKFVLWVDFGGTTPELRSVPVAGGVVTSVPVSGSLFFPFLSPDGKTVAYFGPDGASLFVAPVDTLAGTLVSSSAACCNLQFMPDSAHLLYRTNFTNLSSYSIAAGTSVSLSDDAAAFGPSALSARSFVAFVTGSTTSLEVVPVSGGSPPVDVAPGITGYNSSILQFTSDETRVIAANFVTGALYSAPITGAGPTTLATGVNIYFGIAPDGSHATYRDAAGALNSVSLAGGSPVVLATNTDACMVFSPDGTRLLVQSFDVTAQQRRLVLAATDGSTPPVNLATNTNSCAWQFSADGLRVSFQDAATSITNVVSADGATAPLGILSRAQQTAWAGNRHLVAVKQASVPLSHQNGVYIATVP
jgi:hypothetical protein